MKAVVVFALLACAVVSNAQGIPVPFDSGDLDEYIHELNQRYTYVFPTVPCSWYITSECSMGYIYYKSRVSAFGKYFSLKEYNKNDELLLALILRPDYAVNDYYGESSPAMMFMYDGQTCQNQYSSEATLFGPSSSYGYYMGLMLSMEVGFMSGEMGRDVAPREDMNGIPFGLIEEAEYNGKKCRAYYNVKFDEEEGRIVPDKRQVMYVDSDGFILGFVVGEMFADYNVVCNFTHGTYVTMSDFALSRRNVYGCSDERIYNSPKAYYGQCSASTVGAAITVVAASVIAAIVSLF